MPTHVFVDESKARHLVLAATVVATEDLAAVRAALRRLLLPGQRRLHFHNEQSARRSRILAVLLGLPVSVRLYETAGAPSRARTGCLKRWLPISRRSTPDGSCWRSTRSSETSTP